MEDSEASWRRHEAGGSHGEGSQEDSSSLAERPGSGLDSRPLAEESARAELADCLPDSEAKCLEPLAEGHAHREQPRSRLR